MATRPGGVTTSTSRPTPARSWSPPRPSPPRRPTTTEKAKRKERKEKKVTAILHESVPVRFWDEDLGPGAPRIFTGSLAGEDTGADPKIELSDLTPDAGRALERLEYDVSRDGSTIVTTWLVRERGGERIGLALIDVATGDRRILLDDVESEYENPRFSPDGQSVAVIREKRSTPEEPIDRTVVVVSLADGTDRDLAGTGTSGRPVRWSGRPTVRRWCSSPTRTAGRRCSGWMPSQARSPG